MPLSIGLKSEKLKAAESKLFKETCFKPGQKVKAKLPSLGKFFTATVDSVNKDGTYNVTFQDGERKEG